MQVTLYLRTYPVDGSPVAVSFEPFSTKQVCTLTRGSDVYEAEYRELQVGAPDGAVLDLFQKQLRWQGGRSWVRSTAREVFDLAQSRASGFQAL